MQETSTEEIEMAQATEKQMSYRQDLIDKKVRGIADGYDNRKLMDALMAVNLPVPDTAEEASSQIDALKRGMKAYHNREWMRRVFEAANPDEIKDAIHKAQMGSLDITGDIRRALKVEVS